MQMPGATLHVRSNDAQHILDVACHAIELGDFWHRADGFGKFLQPCIGMIKATETNTESPSPNLF
jgi:hypothetical protein